MLKFKLNKEKSKSVNTKVYDCEIWDTLLTIIESNMYSVFVRRTVYVNWDYVSFIEIWDHRPTTMLEAKHAAEKLYDIVLGYKPIEIWKEY